jgi:hypothetical protein
MVNYKDFRNIILDSLFFRHPDRNTFRKNIKTKLVIKIRYVISGSPTVYLI